MKIKYVNGDLLNAPQKYIAHGVNCRGVMGAGVALAIKNKWPSVFTEYKKYCSTFYDVNSLLGQCNIAYVDNNRSVFNCFTQTDCGNTGLRYISYDAIAQCFGYINYLIKDEVDQIALPKIGAGLGGGDWNVIERIIESECKNIQPYVYEI